MADGFRISESGVSRISESSDIRITEQFVEGLSSLSGAGSLTALETFIKGGLSNLSGVGSLSSQADASYQAASNLSSLGSEITVASVVTRPSVSLSASGSVTATGGNYFSISESYTGTGTSTFLGLNSFDISKSLSGAGTANFNGLRIKNAATSLTGAGTFTNDGFNFVHFGSHLGDDLIYTRVTEAGDTRVDEDSNVRIVIQAPNSGESVLYANFSYIQFSSTAYIKWDGVWKQFDPKVKQDGTWDDPLAIYKKIDANTWKRAY